MSKVGMTLLPEEQKYLTDPASRFIKIKNTDTNTILFSSVLPQKKRHYLQTV